MRKNTYAIANNVGQIKFWSLELDTWVLAPSRYIAAFNSRTAAESVIRSQIGRNSKMMSQLPIVLAYKPRSK
jgi:hypothetical protein